jgi:hypothetical protein
VVYAAQAGESVAWIAALKVLLEPGPGLQPERLDVYLLGAHFCVAHLIFSCRRLLKVRPAGRLVRDARPGRRTKPRL